MSFSISTTKPSKTEATQDVSKQLDDIVASQPVHKADHDAVQNVVSNLLASIREPIAGEQVSISVSGSVGWDGSKHVGIATPPIDSAQVNAYVQIHAQGK